MSKGLALPIVIVFIALFLSVPVFFYLYANKGLEGNLNVKGAASEFTNESGVTLRVSSKGGTWDLHQFLCDERNACLSTLMIGKPWGIVSGGLTENYEFNIDPDQGWDEQFKYLKVFVKSGWGSMFRTFSAMPLHQKDLVESHTITNESKDYTVILIPLENINSNSNILIEFKDY